MASITIRRLSDESKERLRKRAERSGCSLEALARSILDQAAHEPIESTPVSIQSDGGGRAGRRYRAVYPGARPEAETGRTVILLDTHVVGIAPQRTNLTVRFEYRGRRARDRRADAGGRAPRRRPHAHPRGRQGAQGRPAHPRPEGGREAHRVRQGWHGRRPGQCRHRQRPPCSGAPAGCWKRRDAQSAASRPRPRPPARLKARSASGARPCNGSSPATPASPKGG